MDLTRALAQILNAQLGPAYPAGSFRPGTLLLGHIPELDSMAVVGILGAIEEEIGIEIPDDEISAEVFIDFGALESFIRTQIETTR